MLEKEDPTIKKANKVLDYLSEDEETIRYYEIREKAIHDEVSRLRGAREEGMHLRKEEGLKEGIQKGMEKGYKKVAINLLKNNVDIELIKKATGLSEKEIDKLKKEN